MMKEIGAQSKTNAVFMNHSPGALEDLASAVQKGFMAGMRHRVPIPSPSRPRPVPIIPSQR